LLEHDDENGDNTQNVATYQGIDVDNLTYDRLDNKQFEVWDSDNEEDVQNDIDTDLSADQMYTMDSNRKGCKLSILVQWIILFFSLWSTYFNITASALDCVVHFFKAVFEVCGQIIPYFATVASLLPTSLYTFYQMQGTQKDKFKKYTVCPKCHTIYNTKDCIISRHGKLSSKSCSFVEFPNHSQKRRRIECGEALLKQVLCKNGKKLFYPHKVYCYHSIQQTLQTFIDRPGFLDLCEHWRSKKPVKGVYTSIYDGRIWQKFLHYPHVNGSTFLGKKYSIAFQLNLDWFQPFTHSPYSLGAIYLAILNIPREERYRKENLILLSLLPGPKEPHSHQLNNYLKPLVDELQMMWSDGFKYHCKTEGNEQRTFYGALLCISADIPAARKLGGMLSHAAAYGCSKCKIKFKKGILTLLLACH
jgi:hypothetical protein